MSALNSIKILSDNDYGTFTPSSKNLHKLSKLFHASYSELGFDGQWERQDCLSTEIKKAVLRSTIRYSQAAYAFSSEIADDVISENKSSNDVLRYCSPVYPMIHMPFDRSELGGFHIDQIGSQKFRTVWTPITEYDYDGYYNYYYLER